ncbi:MAG: hypothetical protein HQL74_04505 [Magnetococcales bacterium]|nr:hypothetical protein [Magnetococcales bacterium]
MTTLKRTRRPISMLACAALMAGGLAVAQDARADVATATVLGGAALLSTLMHASTPEVVPVPAPAPVVAAQPVGMMPTVIHQPAIYTSVNPIVAPCPVPVAQPYAVPVPVAQPYPVPVPVAQPYAVPVPVPVAQPYVVPVPVVQPVTYQVTTRVIQPVSVQVAAPLPICGVGVVVGCAPR